MSNIEELKLLTILLERMAAVEARLLGELKTLTTSLAGTSNRLLNEQSVLLVSLGEILNHFLGECRTLVNCPMLAELAVKREEKIRESGGLFTRLMKYRYENFHDEMLRMILDKNTEEVGDERYLGIFTELLNEKLRKRGGTPFEHKFENRVTVRTQIDFIDVYVEDDTHVIIIEDKLNYAGPQPNQLARYVRSAHKRNKEVTAVVYLPVWQDTKPPLEDYDKEYAKEVKEIREKMVILPAVELAQNFIGVCADKTENSSSKYVLSQYKKALETIGGINVAVIEVEKEFLKELYKDEDSIRMANTISELWNNRESLLGHLLWEPVRTKLKENGFVDDTKPLNGMVGLCKNIEGSDSKLQVCLLRNGNWVLYPGLRYLGDVTGDISEKVREAINTATAGEYFDGGWTRDNEPDNKCHWHRHFRPWLYLKPLAEIEQYLLATLASIECEGEKLLPIE